MASGYKRVLLKVSGEALAGDLSFGIEPSFLQGVAKQIADVARTGIQVAIVVGGGNIFRGMAGAADGTDRVTADTMGMLGTMINALALSNAISRQGMKSKPFSAATMPSVADTFTARDAKLALEEGFVVVLGGGTGNPFFTTDTAATLRAIELECDVVLKGTKVDGVYSDDPKKNPDAIRYDQISFDDVISQNLKVMDTAAFALARDSRMPIIVYSLDDAAGLSGILEGRGASTLVGDKR